MRTMEEVLTAIYENHHDWHFGIAQDIATWKKERDKLRKAGERALRKLTCRRIELEATPVQECHCIACNLRTAVAKTKERSVS